MIFGEFHDFRSFRVLEVLTEMVCWDPDCNRKKPGEQWQWCPCSSAGVQHGAVGWWWGTRCMGTGQWVDWCTPTVVRVRVHHCTGLTAVIPL